MTVKLTRAQAVALGRIELFGQGSPIVTYHPPLKDMATFRVLSREGYCRYRARTEPGVTYNGYELTEKGRDFLKGCCV